jgi:hypothetical protein
VRPPLPRTRAARIAGTETVVIGLVTIAVQ